MKTLQLTKWFPGDVNPVRIGVYICSVNRRLFYCHWDGENWRCSVGTAETAAVRRSVRVAKELLEWRGPVSDPAEAA